MKEKTIPIEILCEIFLLLCKEPIALHILENKLRFDEFPWAVGQVCRYWREVFLSYPYLWASLSLEYSASGPSKQEADSPDFIEMNRRTVLYLERSRRLPLNITVSIQATISGCIQNVPRAVWKSLLSCSERWKTADLTLTNLPDTLDDLLDCQGKIPNLESTSLGISSWVFQRKTQENTFAVAPRLTELKITHFRENSRWAFPWTQLTKLSIEMDNADLYHNRKLAVVLSQLQNVEELRLVFDEATDHGIFRLPAPIRLSSVRFLEATTSRIPYIFKWFEMPLLEHLYIHDFTQGIHPYDRQIWNAEIESFICRSSCHIRRLTLQNCYRGLAPILMGALPSIEYFCIKDPRPDTAPMFIRHVASCDDNVCLPNLRELHVICCLGQADKELMTAMKRLLEARVKGPKSALADRNISPLERVTVEWGARCSCWTGCNGMNDVSKGSIVDRVAETMRSWPSIADVSVDRARSRISVKLALKSTWQDQVLWATNNVQGYMSSLLSMTMA